MHISIKTVISFNSTKEHERIKEFELKNEGWHKSVFTNLTMFTKSESYYNDNDNK